jgi:formylglycine-generating enzyme required for sulfatase activity
MTGADRGDWQRWQSQLEAAETIPGTYRFDINTAVTNIHLNRFFWNIREPAARAAYADEAAACAAAGLTEAETTLVRDRNWIGLIQTGSNFLVLAKFGHLVGESNLEASMPGESFEILGHPSRPRRPIGGAILAAPRPVPRITAGEARPLLTEVKIMLTRYRRLAQMNPGMQYAQTLGNESDMVSKFRRSRIRTFLTVALTAVTCASGWSAVAASDVPSPPARTTFRDCPDCPEMVVIPSGEFLMGSSPTETERDLADVSLFESLMAKRHMSAEHPQHLVRITQQFALGKYPVTRGEFASFIRQTGYATEGGCVFHYFNRYNNHPEGSWQDTGFMQTDRDPVVCVNWRDAQAYVAWLNEMLRNDRSGGGQARYRLPSEAEWEYGARAGQQTPRWWGNDIAWNNADCDGCGSLWDKKGTAPVGSFRPNQFGLWDVLGNAWEWTEDCWNASYDGAPSDGTAWANGDCEQRVMRGGSWDSSPWVLRSTERTNPGTHDATNYIGFRVARTLP